MDLRRDDHPAKMARLTVGSGCIPVPLDDAFRTRGIEVWRIDLDETREPSEGTIGDLDETEHARLARFRRVGDRARFAHLRSALRRRLGAVLGSAPRAVPIRVDARGKPRLSGDTLRFGLAHSGNHGLIALNRTDEIGIDIERAHDVGQLDALADVILSPGERPVWQSESPEGRHALFLRAWTAKEAVLKAAGSGLMADPKALTVLAGIGALHVCGRPEELGFDPADAVVGALPAPTGYAAALAFLPVHATTNDPANRRAHAHA